MAALIPHSFVLADLFDVEAQSQDVPDDVLEHEPCIRLVTCPTCDGEGEIEFEAFMLREAA